MAGSGATLKCVRTGRVSLVLVSEDSGDSTVRRIARECERWRVPVVRIGNRTDFGRISGRSAVSVMGVTDRSFAAALLDKLGTAEPEVPAMGTETDKGEVDV